MPRNTLLLCLVVLAPAAARAQDAAPAEGAAMARSNKMEFDERLIKGQTAKSGAVYLFKRVPRQLPGLVGVRRSYRARIVAPILYNRKLSATIRHSVDVDADNPSPVIKRPKKASKAKKRKRRKKR